MMIDRLKKNGIELWNTTMKPMKVTQRPFIPQEKSRDVTASEEYLEEQRERFMARKYGLNHVALHA